MAIRVETNKYENYAGKKPRGGCATTPWAFLINGEVKVFLGKYSDAKKQAVAEAEAKKLFFIQVLS